MKIIICSKSVSSSKGGVERVSSILVDRLRCHKSVSSVSTVSSFRDLIAEFIHSIISIVQRRDRGLVICSGFSAVCFLLFPFCKKVFFLHGFYDPITVKTSSSSRLVIHSFFYNRVLLLYISLIRPILVAPSPHSGLVNSVLLKTSSINIIPWGGFAVHTNVDVKAHAQRDIQLLYHGRMSPEKLNPSIFVQCIKSLLLSAKSLDIAPFTVAISGKVDVPLIQNIRFLLASDSSLDCIELLVIDSPDDDQVIELMCNSKFFFNSHPWEAFGISLVEAIQSGCVLMLPSTAPILSLIHKDSFLRFKHPVDGKVICASQPFLLDAPHDFFSYDAPMYARRYRRTFSWDETASQLINVSCH